MSQRSGRKYLGLACTADGLLLGRTPLIARRDERFVVRERREIERLFSRAFGDVSAVERIMPGLGVVARALRVASLVRAFEFAATLKGALIDELSDTEGANELVMKMNAIASTLDESPPGRAPLAALIDHAKDSVRASAGAYLVDLMPDRVVPILREIDQKNDGASAEFTAHWALLDWDEAESREEIASVDGVTGRGCGSRQGGRPSD